MKGTARKTDRLPKKCAVSISWESPLGGAPMFARARTIDVSLGGLQLDMHLQIPVSAMVSVRCDELKINSRGTVRHCTRFGGRYRVGVEFSMPLRLRLEA